MAKNDATPPAENESTGWRPQEGDVVSGNVVAISRAWSDWSNSFYPLVTIHDSASGKDVDVHAFHHTLQTRLMETKPKVGDALEIAYLGKRATKDGKREVAIYRVTVPGATGQEVWDSLDAQNAQASRAAVTGDVPADTEGLPPVNAAQEEIPF